MSKLVRDHIPDIIRAKGQTPETHTAAPHEREALLRVKLAEEVAEFLAEPSTEEAADIIEVLRAFGTLAGFSPEDIERVRTDKHARNGGFETWTVLDDVRPVG